MVQSRLFWGCTFKIWDCTQVFQVSRQMSWKRYLKFWAKHIIKETQRGWTWLTRNQSVLITLVDQIPCTFINCYNWTSSCNCKRRCFCDRNSFAYCSWSVSSGLWPLIDMLSTLLSVSCFIELRKSVLMIFNFEKSRSASNKGGNFQLHFDAQYLRSTEE